MIDARLSCTAPAFPPRGGLRTRGRRLGAALLAVLLAASTAACTVPNAPPYPYWGPYGSREGVINKAQQLSTSLEQYVKDWMDGRVPAEIPASLLPDGRHPDLKAAKYRLLRENEIDPAKQWVVREAIDKINWSAVRGGDPDPHVTYLFNPAFIPPFGTKVKVQGQFPRARFFDVQATPAFQPEQYQYNGLFGSGEVPVVDADIQPLPGHTNPYRVGANRNATNRSFEITYVSQIANSGQVDPAFRPPFRDATTVRSTSGLSYQGPFGDPNYSESNPMITKAGFWDQNMLWVRTYAPDKATNKLGGVPLPKIVYELPDGRRYYIQADLTQFTANINRLGAIHWTLPADPVPAWGANVGWFKVWDIVSYGVGFMDREAGRTASVDKAKIRALVKGMEGRGEDLPWPQKMQSAKTLCAYCTYLARNMSLGGGKVLVLTGRMPKVPKTRNSEATMGGGETRYWSITGYDRTIDAGPYSMPITSIMDDEVVTDANGNFTIVYSRAGDRPANATAANGVTWVDWGPRAEQAFMLRWLDVGPEWTSPKSPNETNLGRASDYASTSYSPDLLERNGHSGFLGQFQPRLSHITKAQFEAIGGGWITNDRVPVWR